MSDYYDINELRELYGRLNLCGCGSPEDAYDLVRRILAACPQGDLGRSDLRQLISDSGVRHIVISILTTAGLLDHGTTLYRPWCTGDGDRLHELMSRYSYEVAYE